MGVAGRAWVIAASIALVTQCVPVGAGALPVSAASSTATPRPTIADQPDPVMYVPEAADPDVARRPEAQIGFGTRVPLVAHRPRAASSGPSIERDAPSRSADAPTAAPAGADPTPGPTPSPATLGHAPDGAATADGPSGAATAVVDAPGDHLVKGTIRGPGNARLSGAGVCLDDSAGYPICVAFTTTAADGTYAVAAPAGSYNVRAFVQGGGALMPGYWSATGYQRMQADAGVVSVDTSDVTGIDITLPPWPILSGTVTGPDGQPVEGMVVYSLIYPNDQATTDVNGEYALQVWPGATGTIRTYDTMRYRTGWYATGGTVALEADATLITVPEGGLSGVDLQLAEWGLISGHVTDVSGNALANLPIRWSYGYYDSLTSSTDASGDFRVYAYRGGTWTGTFGAFPEFRDSGQSVVADDDVTMNVVAHRNPIITGRIVDVAGDPVPGIAVRTGWDSRFDAATSDGDGRFLIHHVNQDPVTVQFSDATGTHVPGVLSDGGFRYRGDQATVYSLAIDDVGDASVTMPAYVHLTGAVTAADGTPVTGGTITPRSPLVDQQQPVTLDGDGSFTMKLAPGPWTIEAGGGTFGAEGFSYLSAGAVPWKVDADRDVQLAFPVSHSITGRVTSGGVALGGIEVDIFLNGSPFTYTTTGADGRYSVAVPPGAYLVGFYDPKRAHANGWYRTSGFTSDPDLGTLVPVGMGDATANMSLPAARHVSGKVVDASAGYAVRYAFVEAFVNGSYYAGQYVKSDGTYSLPVAPGNVTLWVYNTDLDHAPGWRTSTGLSSLFSNASVITVGTSDRTGMTIRVPAAAMLIVDAGWSPAPGSRSGVQATIEAVNAGGTASFDMIVNGSRYLPVLKGSYRLWTQLESAYAGLASGWRLGDTTLTPDYSLATLTTITTSSKRVKITVPQGVSLSGQVRDASGNPLDDVDVWLDANGSLYEAFVTTGGWFSTQALAGTYRVGVADLFGRYQAGWLGATGFVTNPALARTLTVTAGQTLEQLSVTLPLTARPTPPTGVVATPFHASALVSFTPASSSVTRPIFQYAVTATPGGRQCIAATGTSCMVTGLADGTPYTFTVTTSTVVGASAASAPSSPVSPLPVPGAPGSLLATPAGSDVVVSWTAAIDNGSPVTGSLATVSPGGASCAPATPGGTTCTVVGLADGRYTVAVRSTNALGQGPVAQTPFVVDTVAPTVGIPATTLRSGVSMTGSGVPVRVAWTASDGMSGVADTSLELAIGSGAYVGQTLARPTSTSFDGTLASSTSAYRFRAQAVDANQNPSPWATGPATYVTLRSETGTGTSYAGTWNRVSTSGALGGSLRYTSTKGASVSYAFTGRAVTFITRRGTSSGKVAVYIDGKQVTTLDLRASSTGYRWVAWTRTMSSGKHVLKLVNLATSGRPRLYIDGFASLR